jgi:hypothetical protein
MRVAKSQGNLQDTVQEAQKQSLLHEALVNESSSE